MISLRWPFRCATRPALNDRSRTSRHCRSWYLAALLAFMPLSVLAQAYPSRPITLIVPAAAGGTTDTVARVLAQIIQTQTNATVIVDNKSGASGSIGVASATRATPDGYTLLFTIQDAVTIYPLLNKNAPYRVPADFTPILQFGTANVAYFVKSNSKITTLNELVQLAKEKPGKVSYSSAGYGTTSHFALEMLKQTNQIEILHIPYKGSGPQMAAVLADEVVFTSTTPIGAKGFIDGGQLRPLATTGRLRNAAIPDVPMVGETGLPPFTVEVWFGVLGPAKMDEKVAATIDQIFKRAVASPEFQLRAKQLGMDLSRPLSLDAFKDDLVAETKKWEKLIKDSNMALEQ